MIDSSLNIFKRDKDYDDKNTISLCEITLNNLLDQGNFDDRDFLNRVDLLNSLGQNVMISNFREYYKLVNYFARFNINNLRIIIGVLTLEKVLDPVYYNHLKGGILEAFGKLFTKNMKLYVYPALQKKSDQLLTSKNIQLSDDIVHLYNYLINSRKIIDIKNIQEDILHIFPQKVLDLIASEDSSWPDLVHNSISKLIMEKEMFGYRK